mmetsp:Transcript_40280/g.114005  ORF Transcript_40280/g.114005 Transcript_40280/m.114005 type:complete len:315 (+) Transcript_40280:65-1009(+)
MVEERRDSDEEEEEEEAAPDFVPPPKCMRSRSSVSAEAYGSWNQRAIFQPPVYDKADEQIAELMAVLSGSFLFGSCDPTDLQTIVLAMQGPMVLESGRTIIQEGASGDHLYVITEGLMDCYKDIDGVQTCVKTCQRGDLFGELALLYNCPRAASVVSRETSVVWELDRETFNNIVMEAVQRKRAQCSTVLRRVPLFAEMSTSELETIIDALKVECFPQGATIITQGEMGNAFYIIHDGQAVASKIVPEQLEPITFLHQAGDYFGELALLRNEPRAATVVATTELHLLSMDSATFKRLMGPAEEYLQRGASRYDN